MSDMPKLIAEECDKIKEILISKNKAYGNSASAPVTIFSRASASERMRSRIDDKLSRLMKGDGSGNEDSSLDLIGYLILLRIVERLEKAGGSA